MSPVHEGAASMRGVFADGEGLRAVRIDRGLTQEDLADRAGLDVKTVRKAERGGRLDLSTLGRLARALETKPGRLVRRGSPETQLQARRRDAVHHWKEAWEAGDRDAVLAIYDEGATLRLPGGPTIPFHGTFRGKDQILVAHETAWGACSTDPVPGQDFSIYVFGDVAVLDARKGVYLPNGETASLWCVQIFTFDGDRVIDHRVEYDTLELARVLGFAETGAPGEGRGSSR